MRQDLIRKVQEGTHAIENDGTLEQLNIVLLNCFPTDITGDDYFNDKYFLKNDSIEMSLRWYTGDTTKLPTIKVTEFFEDSETIHNRS